MEKILNVINLGLKDYQEVYNLQKEFVKKRYKGKIADTLILTEHSPVFTIGRTGSIKNILAPLEELRKEGIDIYEIDRGGDITYHGPGQIVGYPIIDLRGYQKDIHLYLRRLEEVLIQLLRNFGIEAIRIERMSGVWVKNKKIASIGVGVSKWITYHGFCLNLNPNMSHFAMINPCGLGKPLTSMEEQLNGELPQRREIEEKLVSYFKKVFS
ncbi:MAG TPA: lipoyl(octanoyl) transferase LipB [Candidatus Omnitrophica bacterium]|nr:lipoyl(octanoyl) transferase LipB [Candidatus Omnitrophota bacterium]